METRGSAHMGLPFSRIGYYCKKNPIFLGAILYFFLGFCLAAFFFFSTMVPTGPEIQEYETAAERYLAGDEKIKENFRFYNLNDNQLVVHDKTSALETFKYIYIISEGEVTWSWHTSNKLFSNVILGFVCVSQLFGIIILVRYDKWFNRKTSKEEKDVSSKSKTWRRIGKFVRPLVIALLTAEIAYTVYQVLT